jgi:homoserine dehydrogenase
MMIPTSSQLANVLGSINGILLIGNKGGNTTLTGRGAGGEPTGVAVLSDVVQIARAMTGGGTGATPLGYEKWQPSRIAPASDNIISAYLRLVVRDRPGILARVCALLARHRINIDSVLQEPAMPKNQLPFVMTLEPRREKDVSQAVAEIARLPFMARPPLMMPFADLP